MKRAIPIILAATMALSLTACTKPGPAASGGSTPSAVSSAEAEPVAADNVTFRDESGKVILNSTHIKSVKPAKSDGDNYAVLITFTKDGADILAAATANMIGQEMSLYIYEEQVFSAELTVALYDGELLIGGNYTKDKADSMAESINAGLKGEAPPTEEPIETPQGTIAPGDFPEGWNDITGIVSIADFSDRITEIDAEYVMKDDPLNIAESLAVFGSEPRENTAGWCNGEAAIVPYVITSVDPPLWGVLFGNSGDLASSATVLYENANRALFWLDKENGTMSAPLACSLWLTAKGFTPDTTRENLQAVWGDVRSFVKTVSIMAARLDNDKPPKSNPEPSSTPYDATAVNALLEKMQQLDFSDIAGTYYSARYGNATIIEDGTVMLDTYYIGGSDTPQSNVIFGSTGRWDETDISKPEDAGYIFWRIENSKYYHPQLNSEVLLEDWITLFPPGVQTVGSHYWYGSVINCPNMDTSEYRFVLLIDGESVMEGEVFVRQSQFAGEGAPSTDVLLNGFDFFREIGYSSEQQEILRTTLREFFLSNYPEVKSITIESNTLSRDTGNPDISTIYLTTDTDRIFQIKLDTQASIRKLAVSIYDESGTLLN